MYEIFLDFPERQYNNILVITRDIIAVKSSQILNKALWAFL